MNPFDSYYRLVPTKSAVLKADGIWGILNGANFQTRILKILCHHALFEMWQNRNNCVIKQAHLPI
jgi:hypothetical protein